MFDRDEALQVGVEAAKQVLRVQDGVFDGDEVHVWC